MGLKDTAKGAVADRARRATAGKSNFNEDRTRYVSREFLGWVCYLGSVRDDGQFAGQRVGITSSEADADRWLSGDDAIAWDIRADPFGGLT